MLCSLLTPLKVEFDAQKPSFEPKYVLKQPCAASFFRDSCGFDVPNNGNLKWLASRSIQCVTPDCLKPNCHQKNSALKPTTPHQNMRQLMRSGGTYHAHKASLRSNLQNT
jgi:hypothetical protein